MIACAQESAIQTIQVRPDGSYQFTPLLIKIDHTLAFSSQEHNISTFMCEMKETAFICRNATSKSLLLIDELGRATSNEDGVALAWAVSEWLLKSGALAFFVTHYSQVTLLGDRDMYTTVQNLHMQATITANGGLGGDIAYTHKVSSGPCRVERTYGVDLAHACGWPDEVLQDVSTGREFYLIKKKKRCNTPF